jgi:A/G-specific adenine glycosylase
MWEGLGYYSRVRNMLNAARQVQQNHGGIFPDKFDEIKKLKGVGIYTASAIASLAYNQSYAVVDGNVLRTFSRLFGITEAINSHGGHRKISVLAHKLLDKKQPGLHNQALMDFGATICKPKQPACNKCPFRSQCFAFKNKLVHLFPVKSKKDLRRQRYFNYLVIKNNNSVVIEKRNGNDIWKNLYQFPCIESSQNFSGNHLIRHALFKELVYQHNYSIVLSHIFQQQLTHQTINAKFFLIDTTVYPPSLNSHLLIAKKEDLDKYIFPGVIREFLKNYIIFND